MHEKKNNLRHINIHVVTICFKLTISCDTLHGFGVISV